MSSTIGHALCGAACLMVARGTQPDAACFRGWKPLAGFVMLANLPDLDFLAGFIFAGDVHAFHSGLSHSLFAALVATLIIGLFLPQGQRRGVLLWVAIAITSHIVIDLFSGPRLGLQQSYGAPLFWPFDGDRVRMPVSLFFGVNHGDWDALASLRNVGVVFSEVLVFGSICWVLRGWMKVRCAGRR